MDNTKKIAEQIAAQLSLAVAETAKNAEIALREANTLIQQQQNLNNIRHDASLSAELSYMVILPNTPPVYLSAVADIMALVFGCQQDISTNQDEQTVINYTGVGVNPKLAGYTFEAIYKLIQRERKQFIAALVDFNRTEKTQQGDIFCQNWVQKLLRKINAFARSCNDLIAQDTPSLTEPIAKIEHVERVEKVEKKIDKHPQVAQKTSSPATPKIKPFDGKDYSAWFAEQIAARKLVEPQK